MLRKQKNEKLEDMQKRFAEQQDVNRLAIVDKILKEENFRIEHLIFCLNYKEIYHFFKS